MKRHALLALGRDRPGIVAAVTGVLLSHGANIEDSQMTILRGHFTMALIVAIPEGTDLAALTDELRHGQRLDSCYLGEVEDAAPGPSPSHTVTVYGADQPGIVHAAATVLAEREIDITDLNSRLMEAEREPLYVLMMEVALPDRASVDELSAALGAAGARVGVEVTLRELERDEL